MNVLGSNQCVEEGHSLLRALLRSHRGRIGKSSSARFYENTANRVLKCSPTSVSLPLLINKSCILINLFIKLGSDTAGGARAVAASRPGRGPPRVARVAALLAQRRG